MEFVFRGQLPQNVLSDDGVRILAERQTRALILIGDRVTATQFSWSAKSVPAALTVTCALSSRPPLAKSVMSSF